MSCARKLANIIALGFTLVYIYVAYSISDSVLDFCIATFFSIFVGVFCFGAAAFATMSSEEYNKKCRGDD